MFDPRAYPVAKQGVRLVTEGDPATAVQLTAVVETVFPDGRLELGSLDEARAAALRPGMPVTLEYFREGVVYNLHAPVLEVGNRPQQARASTRPRILVGSAEDMRKIQRRRFPRALVSLNTSFVRVDIPGDFEPGSRAGEKLLERWAEQLEGEGQSGLTETLSGSGMRLRVTGPIAQADEIYMHLVLPDETLALLGRVVSIASGPPREAPGLAVGVELVHLREVDQQAILMFVSGRKQLP